jgi:segregation and condensation protein A
MFLSDERTVENELEGAGDARRGGLDVFLPQFEGPLDLLLHLVRSQDMDILDISIVVIARQYNEYLDAMRELDLELASEYLVMAATLAHIKSRSMLPPEPGEDGQAAADPRAELTRQLIEYERFRKAAEGLAALESGRDLVFARPGPPPPDLAGEFTIKADLTDLVRAFERVVRQLEAEDRVEVIRRDDVKVQDMMQRILDDLVAGAPLSFRALASRCRTRVERIVLFLALLELVRIGSVSAWQAAPREDIRVDGRLPSIAGTGNTGTIENPEGEDR